MKRLLAVAVCGALLSGCTKTEVAEVATEETAPQVAAPRPVPMRSIAPPPAPVVAVVAATPAPEPPALAPAGVFYLTAYLSISSEDGLRGFKPGTRLREIDGVLKSDDGVAVPAQPHQFTNDLRLAAAAARMDSAAIAAARAAAVPVVVAPLPPIAPEATPAPLVRPMARVVTAATPASGMRGAGLDSKAYGAKKAFVDRDGDGRAFEIRKGAGGVR